MPKRYYLLLFFLSFVMHSQADGNKNTALTAHSLNAETQPSIQRPTPTPSFSAEYLSPYSAIYHAKYNGLAIETRRSLVVDGSEYHLKSYAKNFIGNIIEEETFHLSSDGILKPDSYRYKRSIFGKSKVEKITVNHITNESLTQRKNKNYPLPYVSGQLGPMSYQVQLRKDLIENVQELKYQVISRGRIKEYRYERLGEEDLITELGTIKTLKVGRIRSTSDRQTYLWLALGMNYLPVKLLQKEKGGETYEMLIYAYSNSTENTLNISQ